MTRIDPGTASLIIQYAIPTPVRPPQRTVWLVPSCFPAAKKKRRKKATLTRLCFRYALARSQMSTLGCRRSTPVTASHWPTFPGGWAATTLPASLARGQSPCGPRSTARCGTRVTGCTSTGAGRMARLAPSTPKLGYANFGVSRAFLSSRPPNTRRVSCSTCVMLHLAAVRIGR